MPHKFDCFRDSRLQIVSVDKSYKELAASSNHTPTTPRLTGA